MNIQVNDLLKGRALGHKFSLTSDLCLLGFIRLIVRLFLNLLFERLNIVESLMLVTVFLALCIEEQVINYTEVDDQLTFLKGRDSSVLRWSL